MKISCAKINAFEKIAGICGKKSLSAPPLEDICNSHERDIRLTGVLAPSAAKLRHHKVFLHMAPQ